MSGGPGDGATVWLASYPKSGNTWLRAVLSAARTGDPFDLLGTGLAVAVRNAFDVALGISSTDLTDDEAARLRPLADDALATAAATTLVRKIHDGLRTGPDGALVVSAATTRCAVYVVRDPRDVAVSYAHHHGRDVAWAVDQLCLPSARIDPRADDIAVQFVQRLGTWSEHVRSWLDTAPFPVTVLRYEDCLVDPVTAFGAALRFAGLDVAADDLVTAVGASSFERLRDRERADGFAETLNRHSPFFRRGRAGGWREELPADLARRLEDTHAEVMTRLGYLGADAADPTDPTGSADPAGSSAASSASSEAGA